MPGFDISKAWAIHFLPTDNPLTDEMYRLHLDNQPGKGSYIDGLASELNKFINDYTNGKS